MLVIFICTYGLIAVQRVPVLRLDRPAAVWIGSTLLLATGLMTPLEAFRAIDGDVIVFLLGMMIMVAYLERSGFFEWIAAELVEVAASTAQLLALILVSSALLSALFVNDTVCLLVTPIVLKAVARLRRDPVPYLIGIATASNIGSALTISGNPQNMYIGIQSGMPFLSFSVRMIVPVLIALVVDFALLRVIFRREVNGQWLGRTWGLRKPLDVWLTVRALAALLATLGMFSAGMSYPLAAMIGAALVFVVAWTPPREVYPFLDWTVLLFFAGLFVVTAAFSKAGYAQSVLDLSGAAFQTGRSVDALRFSTVTTLLSNLVSNVPAVLLMQPFILHLGGGESWWTMLAMASTFGGNLTLIGSVANLIVAEKAHREGVHLGFWQYLAVGLPLTLVSVLAGTLWLVWL